MEFFPPQTYKVTVNFSVEDLSLLTLDWDPWSRQTSTLAELKPRVFLPLLSQPQASVRWWLETVWEPALVSGPCTGTWKPSSVCVGAPKPGAFPGAI